MNARLFICCAVIACSTLHARPRVIESNVRLPVDAIWVGHWGDQLIAIEEGADSSNPGQLLHTYSANLYHRSAKGQWVFDHTLAYEVSPEHRPRATVVMNATIAAITMANGLRIFERSGGAWTESALDVEPRPNGTPLDLDGTTILATDLADDGECGRRALMLNRAANGHWVESANFPMPADQCVTAVDLDAESAIVRSQTDTLWRPPTVRIFERSGSGWIQAAALSSGKESTPYYGRVVAIHDGLALVSDLDLGTRVYRRGAAGWVETDRFPASDNVTNTPDESLQITDDYVLRVTGNINRGSLVTYLYRQREDQSFEPLAILADDGAGYLEIARVDGNRVFAWRADGPGQPVEFNLPASFAVPALLQNDFESSSALPLTPLPGGSFATVSNGTTHVYRQSSVAGEAVAMLAPDYTNQSISADIRLNEVNGADRWVGLMVRYTNQANFYYVTLRDSNRIVLKRMSNGVFTELGSAPIDVSVGQSYRIGLEASGTHLLVCVDGRIVIRGWDSQLTHGRAGLRMYRAAADFDNVVLTPGPLNDLAWAKREATAGWYETIDQTATDGLARLTSGYPQLHAVVQASISVPWSSDLTERAWAGLVVRYVDAGNYYYVTARTSGQLSLRKLTNGAITVLGTVPFQIEEEKFFLLRLEAIGDKLRVYVNDVLRLERTGASLVPGKVGLLTYRTAARFYYYTAYEP